MMQLTVIQTKSAQELIKWKEICISTLTLYPVTYNLFVHLDKGDCGEHHSRFFSVILLLSLKSFIVCTVNLKKSKGLMK